MAIQLTSPDGFGLLEITKVQHEGEFTLVNMQGIVERYGFVKLTHEYEHVSEEMHGGTISGIGEAVLDHGDVVSSPLMGTFSRKGSKMKGFYTDFVTYGDMKFVTTEVDLITKKAEHSFWSLQ